MSRGVLLKPKPIPLRHAREIVVAPRMPSFEASTYTGALTAPSDVVMDCDTVDDTTGKTCGWHAMGPRVEVKKAYDEHRKLHHANEVGIVLLNVPRQ